MSLGRVPNSLLILVAFLAQILLAQAARTASETELKAAFVYNFAKFVTWPQESKVKPLEIGVLGDQELGVTLHELLEGKNLGGRPLSVAIFTSMNDLRATDVLFIRSDRHQTLEAALRVTHGMPVLTVGESADFTELGGIVQLVREGNKMRFDVNVAAAEDAGLRIQAQLLKLARNTSRTEASR
jgi:hypothetical protein